MVKIIWIMRKVWYEVMWKNNVKYFFYYDSNYVRICISVGKE